MSKKTIISDFGALKGKVTFSGRSDVHDSTTKKLAGKHSSASQNPATSPTTLSHSRSKESHMKVGQRVVMMDSDLRGKIVSLGRRVCIELEDGLIIEASYGEFAVTDNAEIEALKSSKAKLKPGLITPQSHYKPAKGILEVDLHIEAIPGGNSIPKDLRLQFQMDTFKRIIHENIPHKGLKISFIHGIGDGILKTAIRKELDEVCSFNYWK